jgi:hypothetical protein
MKVRYLSRSPGRVGQRIRRQDLEEGEVCLTGNRMIYTRYKNYLLCKSPENKYWTVSCSQPWHRECRDTTLVEIIDYEGYLPTDKDLRGY